MTADWALAIHRPLAPAAVANAAHVVGLWRLPGATVIAG